MPSRHSKAGDPSSSSPSSGRNGKGDSAPVNLSDLQKKPCLLCGREITPRAAFAKNWDDIKYCSDSCRRQKKLHSTESVPIAFQYLKTLQEQGRSEEQGPNGVGLWASSTTPTADGTNARVNIEDWVENTILHVAGRRGSKGRPTLEDVEEALKAEARNANQNIRLREDSSGSENTPLDEPEGPADLSDTLLSALDAAPGLRERVRRAARRLVVLSPDESQDGSRRRKLRLRQGKRDLVTLEDVSYAKGVIELCLDN